MADQIRPARPPRRVRVQGNLFHGRVPAGACYVGRAAPGLRKSPYANPFKTGEPIERGSDLWPYATRLIPGGTAGFSSVSLLNAEDVVAAYSWWVIEQPHLMLRMAEELGHRDLACWCRIGRPCHADDLLALVAELASTPGPEPYRERR